VHGVSPAAQPVPDTGDHQAGVHRVRAQHQHLLERFLGRRVAAPACRYTKLRRFRSLQMLRKFITKKSSSINKTIILTFIHRASFFDFFTVILVKYIFKLILEQGGLYFGSRTNKENFFFPRWRLPPYPKYLYFSG
jgi:hypothetical protein